MKLKELVKTILATAGAQPAINSVFEGDVYVLNELKDVKYSAFVATQGNHTMNGDFTQYNFNLFYVDRLTSDLDNKVDVQSMGIDVLSNILRTLEELGIDIQSGVFTPFTNRFEAECAGVYVNVTMLAPNDLCPDWFDVIMARLTSEDSPYNVLSEYAKKMWVIEKIQESITGFSGMTRAEVQSMIDSQEFKTINGSGITGSGNLEITYEERPYSNLEKICDYFWEADYTYLDYDFAKEYFNSRKPAVFTGGCTSVLKDGEYGRNLDWFYGNGADFYVRTSRTHGLAGGISQLTEQHIEENKRGDLYKILPFYMQDGENLDGVCANINVVLREESKGANTYSIPAVEKREEICSLMLVRYILDRFSSAQQACEYIRDYVSVFLPQGLIDMGYESHWMIGDKNRNSYALEIVNGRIVFTPQNILTNFYNDGVEYNEDGSLYSPYDVPEHIPSEENNLTPYASGVERYNQALRHTGTMRELMNSLMYTKTYTEPEGEDYWYSEAVGSGLTIDTPASDFSGMIASLRNAYQHRDRNNPVTWQTTHSCVYNLSAYTLNVVVQEDITHEYQFQLNAQGQMGPQGPQGARGEQGPQGERGTDGAQGATGAQGIQGAQGERGADGAQGATGAQGARGEGGVTPQDVQTIVEDSLTAYTKSDNFMTINHESITEGGNKNLVVNRGSVSAVWALTQAEYEALPSHDNTILYVIL